MDNGALRSAAVATARLMFLSNSPPGEVVPKERRTGNLPTRRYATGRDIWSVCSPPLTLKCEMSRRRHLIAFDGVSVRWRLLREHYLGVTACAPSLYNRRKNRTVNFGASLSLSPSLSLSLSRRLSSDSYCAARNEATA